MRRRLAHIPSAAAQSAWIGAMTQLQPWLLVMVGSALGGGARLWLSTAVARPMGSNFPWGTLAVNLLGCLLVGVLGAVFAPPGRMHDV
jgi:fluoride ion exporter CrcB/FEX